MRLKRTGSDSRLLLRIQGRVRLFCCPLRVTDSGPCVSAVMAPISRSVPSTSPARKGRFCPARRMESPRFDGCRGGHPPLIRSFDVRPPQTGAATLSSGTFIHA